MEQVRHEQLREILALQVLPELKELKRRQKVLQTTVWIGTACMLAGMVIFLGLVGVLVSAEN